MRALKDSMVLIGLLLATVTVGFLTAHSKGLRTALDLAEERARILWPGSFAPQLTLLSIDGDSVRLGRTDADFLVYYVYNTRCPFSELSIPAWKSLTDALSRTANVKIIGINTDELEAAQDYAQTHALNFRTVVMNDLRTRDSHRFGAVPQTLVMDPEGRVLLSRFGMLETGAATDSILSSVRSNPRQ